MVKQIHQRPEENSKIKTKGMKQIQTTSSLDGIHQREKYIQLTKVYHKLQAITKKILDCRRDTKQLFSVVKSITNNRQTNPLPDYKSHEEIANDFMYFLIGKLPKIRDEFSGVEEFKLHVNNIPQLKQFSPLKMEEVQKEIMSVKKKSCELNTIPTNLLKEILPSCTEAITHIVNTSLTKGIFANNWKTAIVSPLLK